VLPARRPMSAAGRAVIGTVLTTIAVLLCGAHFVWHRRTVQDMQAETQRLQEPAQMQASLQARIKTLEAKRAEVQQQHDSLAKQTRTLEGQRGKLAELLAALAAAKADDLVIQKIDSASGEPCVCGLCLQPELADELASRLARTLIGLGWDVQSAQKR